MCGIAGVYNPNELNRNDLIRLIGKMSSSLEHRGPDGKGNWIEESGRIALGHTRLSIIDLTETGRQPMISKSGKYIIVFNGEIYNHADIRLFLEQKFKVAIQWNSHSDTETLLEAIDMLGIQQTVNLLKGMFAFAVWNKISSQLILCRDRMGEKPLYYGWVGGNFYFASQLGAIEKVVSKSELNIDSKALGLFFKYSYVPTPLSIYKEIRKLEPGTILIVPNDGTYYPKQICYWNAYTKYQKGLLNPFDGNFHEAKEKFEILFSKSVQGQLNSDVPIGAFLSGGIDSACVVSEMVRQSSKKINTFTLGFGTKGYDERDLALKISKSLITNHTDLLVTDKIATELVPEVASIYDEPFADSSQIPTILVSELVRKHVTVSLSGDGGDEFFGGYPRYDSARTLNSRISKIDPNLRKFMGKSIANLIDTYRLLDKKFIPALSESSRKIQKFSNCLIGDSHTANYFNWVTHWSIHDKLFGFFEDENDILTKRYIQNESLNSYKDFMFLDAVTYLSDEILTKVDRGTMSRSLESRAPFLDHDLIEFAWSLPLEHIKSGSMRKLLLREFLNDRIQDRSLFQTKTGFSVPLGSWLRTGLREWAEDLIKYKPCNECELNEKLIGLVWEQHLSEKKDNSNLLWSVLIFKDWARSRGL
jgi:asparagine synthase (glutamine-hydrolysing)